MEMEAETKKCLTIGEFLKQVREQNNLTLEEVADQLKLKVSTVRELEENCYDKLGGLVYIKGYLRSYARLLHLNIEDQLQSTNEGNKANPIFSEFSEEKNKAGKEINKTFFRVENIFAIVAIIISISALFFYYEKGNFPLFHNKVSKNSSLKTVEKADVASSTTATRVTKADSKLNPTLNPTDFSTVNKFSWK